MLKFKEGDKGAFDELLDLYQKPVINIIYRMIQDKTEADDLAQEVFLRVYNYAKTYKPEAKFLTWIYQITKNICLNELRRQKKKVVSIDETFSKEDGAFKKEYASTSASPLEYSYVNEIQEMVKKAIEGLSAKQRMVVILRRYDELSYEDIATTMGCSVSAVKSLLNRAKESLKGKLGPYISRGDI
ncbi:MAG: sigma-70 family RNA polymerase sigma factor [Nitrospirota bacterium]|nr:sigma-70 family RNA polymerase sigma factor [Nitrospirota bacterium]